MSADSFEFSVWAPFAKKVHLIMGKSSLPMSREGRGWWRLVVSGRKRPLNYRFSVDDGAPFPDPRSRWQPHGVHGDSSVPVLRPKRKTAFKPAPLSQAVFYELHVGTFTEEGTYRAAQGKLKYLSDLGVTYLELMPLATFPGERGWGYDGVSLYAPHPAYGTPEDLGKFIAACHARGIAVILDVVYNHLGPDGNYLPRYGPYFNDRKKTPWGSALNFDDAESDEVRRFFIENALMWLRDYGFDGLRLDAVHAIEDSRATHFLEELAAEIAKFGKRERKTFFVVAESDRNDPRLVLKPERGGYGLDAHWIDDFHHAIHAYFTGERDGYYADFGSLAQVAKALTQGYVFDGQFSPYRRRCHGRVPSGVSPLQLVVFNQNHDQIGNRAQGERLGMMLDVGKLKAIAALTLLSPFLPLIFQGEEWGARTPFLYFTDHTDKKLGKLVTEGRRREFAAFGWKDVPDPQAKRTFLQSKLQWKEIRSHSHKEMLQWYRDLIRLRKIPGLLAHDKSDFAVSYDEERKWLVLRNGKILGIFNFDDREQAIPLPSGNWKVELLSKNFRFGKAVPPGAVIICSKAKRPTAGLRTNSLGIQK